MVLQFFIFAVQSFPLLFYSMFFFFHSPLFFVIPQFYGNSANYKRINGGFFRACWKEEKIEHTQKWDEVVQREQQRKPPGIEIIIYHFVYLKFIY